jgi:hypothetical protein
LIPEETAMSIFGGFVNRHPTLAPRFWTFRLSF